MRLNKIFFFLIVSSSYLFSQNINYAVGDIHSLTLPKKSLTLGYSQLLMNDTLDILKLKQSEFGNSKSFSSIGDLKGSQYKVRYGIFDDLMLHLEFEKMNISYGSSSIINSKKDLFLRYNFFNVPYAKLNSGLSLDIGYVTNQLDNTVLDDIADFSTQKQSISTKIDSYDIQYSNGVDPINNEPFPRQEGYYISDNGILTSLSNSDYNTLTQTITTINDSNILLKDTQDKSKYARLITGFHTNNSSIDFYFGYKKTKIDTIITLDTLAKLKELYNEVETIANNYNQDLGDIKNRLENIEKNLNREEKMYSIGFSTTTETKNFIIEFGYEYDKFIRDDGLDYIDFNHVIDFSLSYKMSNKFIVYGATKIMYRQLNGQIPYLYNEYTQTSYDHKYGYTKFGVQYRF